MTLTRIKQMKEWMKQQTRCATRHEQPTTSMLMKSLSLELHIWLPTQLFFGTHWSYCNTSNAVLQLYILYKRVQSVRVCVCVCMYMRLRVGERMRMSMIRQFVKPSHAYVGRPHERAHVCVWVSPLEGERIISAWVRRDDISIVSLKFWLGIWLQRTETDLL